MPSPSLYYETQRALKLARLSPLPSDINDACSPNGKILLTRAPILLVHR